MPGGGLKNIGASIKRGTNPSPRVAPPAKAFIEPSRIDAR